VRTGCRPGHSRGGAQEAAARARRPLSGIALIKIRDGLEAKLEALLTDAQKKQWKEMLGQPMDLADLFDLFPR
jgi:hypothetical protein